MKNARQTAFDALLKVQKDGAFSNLAVDSALNDNPDLDERDRAFVCTIVYGTLDRQIIIDYNLGLYLNQPARKLKPELRTILRMGAYQILFLDKVPASAAVNESVKLAKENKSAFAASLVNAVLRRVSDNGLRLPDEKIERLTYLSIRYSCPEWIFSLWIEAYGEVHAIRLAESALDAPPVVIRVNTLRTTPEDLIWSLAEEGVIAEKSESIENALILKSCGSVEKLDAYRNGLFHVQDTASQICCKAFGAKAGEKVFDLCSAPGGKTFTITQYMENKGSVLAFDIYQSRVELIRKGAERLGESIVEAGLSDALIYNPGFGFCDRILCDVPCSGLGIIRRKPEIRYKTPEEIDELPGKQYQILCNAADYLKPGGTVLYSTCTLNPKENSGVCDRFLEEHPDFENVPVFPDLERYSPDEKYLTLMPHLHGCDGFFIACLRKKVN